MGAAVIKDTTMIDQLLLDLADLGVRLQIEDGTLMARGRVKDLTPALKAQIQTYKPALMIRLGSDIPTKIASADSWMALEEIVLSLGLQHQAGMIDGEALEQHMATLKERAKEVPPAIPSMLLSELQRCGEIAYVQSKVLGETVQFAANNCAMTDVDPKSIVYTATELAKLNGVTPEQLRSIHKVKKELDGEVVGSKQETKARLDREQNKMMRDILGD